MKVFITTYGSRGDVQPYVALGKGLRRAGHQVTLATSDRFRDFVLANDLSYGYLNDRLLSILDTDQGKDLMENTTGILQILKRTLTMMREVSPLQRSLLEESWQAARDADPDLIIFHPKSFSGPDIAEKLGVPALLGLVIPMLIPSSERPHIGFPKLPLGGWYNRLTYAVVQQLMAFSASRFVGDWRRKHGLPGQRKFNLLHHTDGKPVPAICGYSPHVFPSPSDWPEWVKTTGYWYLDEPSDWQPDQRLLDFLDQGPPPVYVGFGSMSGRRPDRLATIVVDSLKRANLRGIIATGWGGLRADSLPDSILSIDSVPHAWLFPRTAAVVHHGGAGTTAAGLRAGRPTIIVPFFGDQPFWGQQVYELGVGSKPIPQKKLTTERLTEALVQVTSEERIVAAARGLGEKIRAEDGVGEAVRFITTRWGCQSSR